MRGFVIIILPCLLFSFCSSMCFEDREGYWSVGIVSGPTPFSLSPPMDTITVNGEQIQCHRNPVFMCSDVTDVNATFVADPFLFFPNGTSGSWYLFGEVKVLNEKGVIGVSVSKDEGRTWTYMGIAVTANIHLSYPFTFEYKGEIYMMPQGSTHYYKAVHFPLEWKRIHAVHNSKLHDATIVYHQGKYWLFAMYFQSQAAVWKHVLYSDSPLGPWKDTKHNCLNRWDNVAGKNNRACSGNTTEPHKAGVFFSNTGLRPGGGFFEYQGQLYRPTQGAMRTYGDRLDLNIIESVTVDNISKERTITEFWDNFQKKREYWNSLRMHHLDLHVVRKADGSDLWVGVMDGDWYISAANKFAPSQAKRCKDYMK